MKSRRARRQARRASPEILRPPLPVGGRAFGEPPREADPLQADRTDRDPNPPGRRRRGAGGE
ncbi:MAG: hypothetical protein MZU97_14285 [Bacillus subtilis]|nr:hypothetical protein [Bacillus subtilis]